MCGLRIKTKEKNMYKSMTDNPIMNLKRKKKKEFYIVTFARCTLFHLFNILGFYPTYFKFFFFFIFL